MAEGVSVIWVGGEAEYFCERDWTGQITLKSLRKIDLSIKSFFRALPIYPTCRTNGVGCLHRFHDHRWGAPDAKGRVVRVKA
jgi:hypothetical protein